MEQKGIEQTKEMIAGLNELVLVLAGALKDGFQAQDVAEVYAKLQGNPEVSAKLLAAYNKIEEVPAEIKDITLVEGVELSMIQVSYLPKLVELVQKKA